MKSEIVWATRKTREFLQLREMQRFEDLNTSSPRFDGQRGQSHRETIIVGDTSRKKRFLSFLHVRSFVDSSKESMLPSIGPTNGHTNTTECTSVCGDRDCICVGGRGTLRSIYLRSARLLPRVPRDRDLRSKVRQKRGPAWLTPSAIFRHGFTDAWPPERVFPQHEPSILMHESRLRQETRDKQIGGTFETALQAAGRT